MYIQAIASVFAGQFREILDQKKPSWTEHVSKVEDIKVQKVSMVMNTSSPKLR